MGNLLIGRVSLLVAVSFTLAGCASCDDDGSSWRLEEEVDQGDAGMATDANEQELNQPVLHDTLQTAMGCCDDLYVQFETKEPRCFEVHIRWAVDPSYFDVNAYPEVSVVPEDPNLSLVGVTMASSRCESSDIESGELVREVSGTIENGEPAASLASGVDLQVRIPGESVTRRLEADLSTD